MADDGMLMNFAVDSTPLQIKPVFKGGRWKDRLQAKKSLQRRQQRNQTNGALTGSNALPTGERQPTAIDVENSRPVKTQKLSGTSRQSHNNSSKSPKEVVSSLFTYNPSSKVTNSDPQQSTDLTAPSPSNVPLSATTSPFTSLGLSPFLSTHLTHSLSLTAPTAIQKAALSKLLAEDSDAFIQAETGSGKTLAYLLPIIQRMMALSTLDSEKIVRSSGLFALILAPTRELTHQISSVLKRLLRNLPHIVSGTITGGSTKNHEKSKIRKGLNILVATPGRLVDHLAHTEALDVSDVRWLVLDEGDRLMELGFEEEIKTVVKRLDKRENDGKGLPKRVTGLPEKKRTVLCSATMKMGVQRLGEISLKDAVHIKADLSVTSDETAFLGLEENNGQKKDNPFLAPAQLRQSYIITPPKQRLVTLAALLKRSFARKGSVMKAIVFLSCADSVDFHFGVFARKLEEVGKEKTASEQNSRDDKEFHITSWRESTSTPEDNTKTIAHKKESPLLTTVSPTSTLSSTPNPNLILHKLHGSLDQKLRTATLNSFIKTTDPAILLCTDVASRGLDLPNIDFVIEYDPPFSADDHLHRVGRTARAGKEGRACCFLMPGEEEGYVDVLKECAGEGIVKRETAEEVLRKGFVGTRNGSGGSTKWDEQATEWQLQVERWVIDDKRAGEMARKAFISHVRAYATHVARERTMFDVKALHLGHLAKAFALRERPENMGRGDIGGKAKPAGARSQHGEKRTISNGNDVTPKSSERRTVKADLDLPANEGQDAARKMRAKMKEHMAGASEFNIG